MNGRTRRTKGCAEDNIAAMARKERLERVVSSYCKGVTCIQIAKSEGVPLTTVYNDLRVARKIFYKRNNEAAERLIFEQAKKIDEIERAAWEGWERSVKDATERTKETNADGETKLTKKVKGQAGDPQFLAIAMKAVDQRCKLFKIGQYSKEDSGTVVARLIEIVVDSPDQINQIMEFGDYQKLTDDSQVIEGTVIDKGEAYDEDTTHPDQ
jgi:hypothetical protein